MSQRSIMLLMLVSIVAMFCGLVIYDMTVNHRLEKILGNEKTDNWQWKDSWTNSEKINPIDPVAPKVEPITPDVPKTQITVSTYQEALTKSEELGMPIMILFGADWCQWCVKMHKETLPDSNVKSVMMNYIFLKVNTDNDRDTTKIFGISGLPSYVICNSTGEKLKSGSGFKNANDFSEWLNNPSMFNQEKKSSPKETPPTEEMPNRRKHKNQRTDVQEIEINPNY